jgi:hypothetical protein
MFFSGQPQAGFGLAAKMEPVEFLSPMKNYLNLLLRIFLFSIVATAGISLIFGFCFFLVVASILKCIFT